MFESGSAEPVTDDMDCVDAGEVLGMFFRTRHINPVIKPQSIANALRHYVDLPEQVRFLGPHETVEGETWSKIKRGKLRILTRFGDGDKLLFHIYDRKEWNWRG